VISAFSRFSIDAPCKINVRLAVGARRGDGFHDIESVFLALDLCDTLDFEWGAPRSFAGECRVIMDTRALPPPQNTAVAAIPLEENLVYKAFRLAEKRRRVTRDVTITVHKRIPCGAGLGGGSSDAAAVLRALTPPRSPETRADAARLGSDVPFFLRAGAALVRGRGERLRAFAAPQGVLTARFVLTAPDFASPTARAFALLDEARSRRGADGSGGVRRTAAGASAGAAVFWKKGAAFQAQNDFLDLFLREGSYKEKAAYTAILDALRSHGAAAAGLSGSGSACFGVFFDADAGEAAAAALRAKWPFAVCARFFAPLCKAG
jgi:4-diphosphocytidyl-2-C-methyl-D-erythritol kinase